MLSIIGLKNFKSHHDTTIRLDDSRLHAIVGQNSSGKTSVLQALHYLSQLGNRPFSAIFEHERSPEYLASSNQSGVSVWASGFWGYVERQDWTAGYSWEKRDRKWSPKCCWSLDSKPTTESGWASSLQAAQSPIPQAIGHAVYLKLNASNLSRPEYSDDVVPRVEYDGTGLAPVLDYMRGEEYATIDRIQSMLRRVVPGVRGIDVRRAKVNIHRQRTIEVNGQTLPYEEEREVSGQEVIFDIDSGDRIPAHAISEGTLLTLGLLTVISSPRTPNLILLDDIEQGLHPLAQRELVGVLKQVLTNNQNLQILFTTHSPYIVDELAPSQVHVLRSTDQGYAVTRRLDEHPDVEWATSALTTGEFWDAEGESWVKVESTDD